MTEQERIRAFIASYEQIVAVYGIQWTVQLKPRQFGAMIQIEPEIAPGLVPNWTPSEPEDKPKK